MRRRIWALVAIAILLTVVSACAAREGRGLASTPAPTKTLRPTFTATLPPPTAAPTATPEVATVAPTEPPAPTAEPATPTPEPSPTPEAAAFTVTSAALNVRSGPGTNFGVIGRLTSGQTFPITGKNAQGTWWEFDYNGRKGWVVGTNVSVKATELVAVAQNIPTPPTAAPRPTARPVTQAQPTAAPQPAPAAGKYATFRNDPFPDTNDWITVYCILYDRSGNAILPGTIRVLRDGQPVASDTTFTEFPTYYLNMGYNAGCKVEIRPATSGSYTAVIVEGNQVVSDPINFTVSSTDNRIRFVAWKQR